MWLVSMRYLRDLRSYLAILRFSKKLLQLWQTLTGLDVEVNKEIYEITWDHILWVGVGGLHFEFQRVEDLIEAMSCLL
jgi:hypothetical protein